MYIRILCLIAILCTSCASNPSRFIPQSYDSHQETGLIVGTITIINQRPYYDGISLFYKPVDDKRGNFINVAPERWGFKRKFKPDFQINDTMIFPFVYEHAPGSYEFWHYQLHRNFGYTQEYIKPKEKFSVPFEIEKGKITYVGNIVLTANRVLKNSAFEIKDHYDRDMSFLKEKYPNINWTLSTNKSLAGKKIL